MEEERLPESVEKTAKKLEMLRTSMKNVQCENRESNARPKNGLSDVTGQSSIEYGMRKMTGTAVKYAKYILNSKK